MKDDKKLAAGQESEVKKSERPAAPKKSFKESLARFGAKVAKWGRDLKGEVKKIVWPGWKQTKNNTIVVITVIAIMTVAVWILDLIFENVILKGLLTLVTGF